MKHEHEATTDTHGHWAEYCECGAVRILDRQSGKYEPWHVCDLCRLPGYADIAPVSH